MCWSFMWFMHFLKRAQFLNPISVSALRKVAVRSPVSKIYWSKQSQRLHLIFFCLKFKVRIIFIAFTVICNFLIVNSISLFFANFSNSLSELLNDLKSFEFLFYMMRIIKLNQTMVAAFFKDSKVISSGFLMIKNIVTLSSSSLATKQICCFKLRFFNLILFLKGIATNWKCFEKYS